MLRNYESNSTFSGLDGEQTRLQTGEAETLAATRGSVQFGAARQSMTPRKFAAVASARGG
jgi:hypothetical protein